MLIQNVRQRASRTKPQRRKRAERRRRCLIVHPEAGERSLEVREVPVDGNPHQERKIVDGTILWAEAACADQSRLAIGGRGLTDRRPRPHALLKEPRTGFHHNGLLGHSGLRSRRQSMPVDIDDHVAGVGHSHRWPPLQLLNRHRQMLGMKLIIVAEKQYELGFGELDQPIEVRGSANVVLERPIHQAWISKRGHYLGRIVFRCVVGDHQGEIAVGLRKHALDRPREQTRPVASRYADGDIAAGNRRRRLPVRPARMPRHAVGRAQRDRCRPPA